MHWHDVLEGEKQQPYFKQIIEHITQRRQAGITVYPPNEDMFNAFKLTDFSDIKVVILGQDPYHGPNQAHGLAFSVKGNVRVPPSLLNIYKELANDIEGFVIPQHGNLTSWAEQGVLLLNTVLSVESGNAHSHAKIGWETFTDKVIEKINAHTEGTVFLLWGSHAQKKGKIINTQTHCVLSAPHPSPLSAHRGFLGCQHFSKTNDYLRSKNRSPIQWQV